MSAPLYQPFLDMVMKLLIRVGDTCTRDETYWEHVDGTLWPWSKHNIVDVLDLNICGIKYREHDSYKIIKFYYPDRRIVITQHHDLVYLKLVIRHDGEKYVTSYE
jgi:hypothetical protein